MSFFYDLNKRLADLATKQDAKQIKEVAKAAAPRSRLAESLDESAFQAAIGKKKYGDEGMKALQKAGREHAGKEKMAKIRNKYDKYDESQGMTDEGNAFTGALASTPKGGKFKVGNKEFTDTSSLEEVGMTPKQKSFAKLAPPADKITFADKIAGAKKEVDEMLGDVAAEAMKAALGKGKRVVADEDGVPSSTGGTIHKTARGLRHTAGKNYGALDVSNDDSDMDDDKPRVKGRPKGSRRAIGAKGPGVKSKLLNKPSIKEEGNSSKERAYNEIIELLKNSATDINPAIRNRLMRLVRQLNVSEPVAEKATSKAQQRFMGMVHAIQKGEKVKGASSELKKTAKGMKKKDAEDFAATKHKGLPEKVKAKKTEGAKPDFLDVDKDGDKKESMKKASSDKKEKKVDETTVAGSVATAPATPKASKGMVFGKGVYESLDSKLEKMITEGMNVTVTMNSDADGDAQKSITVTATGAEADKLAELLKMAGLGQQQEACPGCGSVECGCEAEMVDENSPDWPTNKVTGGENDPNLRTYSGGLNKPKSTGQTTIPTLGSADRRRQVSMEENVELERTLFKTWKNYKG
jgi:hypothetical protein